MEAAGTLIPVSVISVCRAHVRSGSFLAPGPSLLTEFMTLLHLRTGDKKCKIEINPLISQNISKYSVKHIKHLVTSSCFL